MTADQLREIQQRCKAVRDAWNLCREVQQLQIEIGNLKQLNLNQFSHCGVK